ncbi:hypothetical protein [Pyxidicoccus sp. MSG2]|uniref:hypothetical protein n=1 Tax=Pyxidicoccus sp. MSG2 TaxID=2996790 RepID=UPI00226D92CF|nr:hypothetical protein [Pyxidicoccus sp. MSG2]MCY1016116.1 hypothetical protein [Pyxidicoccus sp. MSG2]
MASPRAVFMTLLTSGCLALAATLMAVQGTGAQAAPQPQAAPLAAASQEFGIDLPVRLPASEAQLEPAVAFDGTNYLVVWADHREGLRRGSSSTSTLMGARVSRDGQLLDPFGFEITDTPHYHAAPSVAFDGTNFLVVWERQLTPSSATDIHATRVSPAGQVIDPAPAVISSAGFSQESPRVAFDGTNFLVVWLDWRNGSSSDVYGARVGRDGKRIGTDFPISTGPQSEYLPTVAFGGSEFLVVWSDSRSGTGNSDLYGTRISTAGTVLEPSGRSIISAPGSQGAPALVSDGTQYLLAWEDNRAQLADGGTAPTQVYAARLALDGTPVSGSARALLSGGYQVTPVVAAARDGFLVTWQDYRGPSRVLPVVRLDASGAQVSTSELPVAPAPYIAPFSVGSDGETFLLAWAEQQTTARSWDVLATKVGAAAELPATPATLLSVVANTQKQPTVAFDGEHYVVAWVDNRNALDSGQDIYAARVGTDGALLDLAGVPVTTAPDPQASPRIACEGGRCLVVWENPRDAGFSSNSDVYAARLTSDAGVLEAREMLLTPTPAERHNPAVASDGHQYQVVWNEWTPDGFNILGLRVPHEGEPGELSPIPICTATHNQVRPVIAAFGGLSLVVWNDSRSNSFGDLYAARIDSDGGVLDPDGQPLLRASWSKYTHAVSASEAGFLVAWEDGRSSTSRDDIYGARVLLDGGLPDGTGRKLAIAPGYQSEPALAFNGTRHVAVWRDTRDDLSTDTLSESHLYGQVVPTGGGDLDGGGFSVAPGPFVQAAPAVASDGRQRALVVYERRDAFGDPRLRARWVSDMLANGSACAVAGECASGYCVDGVCCNTACGGGVCEACSVAEGAPVDGVCAPLDGRSCDDGNACSHTDTCNGRTCGGMTYQCSPGQCENSSSCDGQGGCSAVPRPNGSVCNDGNACTTPDSCQAGSCVGAESDVCQQDAGTEPPRDAGTNPPQDAGTNPPQDAGTDPSRDAGTSPPPPDESSGCGCGATSGGFELALALGAGAILRRRRRS